MFDKQIKARKVEVTKLRDYSVNRIEILATQRAKDFDKSQFIQLRNLIFFSFQNKNILFSMFNTKNKRIHKV